MRTSLIWTNFTSLVIAMHQEKIKYSVVIPVYNRNEELRELLQSLSFISRADMEVIVVDDGSSQRADLVVDSFRDKLNISYYYKPNSGPGPSRNYGFQKAKGDYLVVFDSDCEVPAQYFDAVDASLQSESFDAWGGPDRASESYSALQKAISYAMTSFLTTGGIRGGKSTRKNFQPRSFNMGMSKDAYHKSGGFKLNRLSEDIELSIRLRKLGLKIGLIENAYVYHKRRSSLSAFFKQVFSFGKGRASLIYLHAEAVKPAHLFPSFMISLFIISFFITRPLSFAIQVVLGLYFTIVFLDSLMKSKQLSVSILSVVCTMLQLLGYGLGFIKGLFTRPL